MTQSAARCGVAVFAGLAAGWLLTGCAATPSQAVAPSSPPSSTSLSSSYNGSDSCEPAVALGSITMTRQ